MTERYVYFHSEPGYLRITGEDRIAFLQRQTTNDVDNLPENHHLSTVLITPAARILDVLQVFAEDENTLGVITLPGRAAETAAFLKRRIFFMDKVSVADASPDFMIADIEGSGSADFLEAIGVGTMNSNSLQAFTLEGIPLRILAQYRPEAPGFRLVAPAAHHDHLASQLERHGVNTIAAAAYHARRILAGRPSWENELTEEYTPLEIGLEALVSGTKGCYTGQEVLARQVTYDKITRSLAGLRLTAPTIPGAVVTVDSQKIGTITSTADETAFGPIALAVLKRPHFEPGTLVDVESEGQSSSATVVSLPFE